MRLQSNHVFGWVSLLLLSPLAHAANATVPKASTPVIAPGDGRISGALLRPYDNVWAYTVTTPDGQKHVQGLWTDHVQKTQVEGMPALLRVQGVTFVNGRSSSTVNIFDPVTLAPFSGRQQGVDGETQSRVFKEGHVSVSRKDKTGVESKNETDLPRVPFDFNGGMYGLILVGTGLRDGLEGQFDSIEEFSEEPVTESFHVIGREKIAAGARGTLTASKVLVERPGKYKMTFWLTQVPPYIIKLEYSAVSRPEIWDWDMI